MHIVTYATSNYPALTKTTTHFMIILKCVEYKYHTSLIQQYLSDAHAKNHSITQIE